MHRLTEEINRRGENAEDVLDASIERYREREAMRDEDKRRARNAGGDEEEVAPGVVFERGPKYEGSNPFRKRAIVARARADQLGKPTAHERGMEQSFPLGGGYGRKGGEARIESSINRSVKAVKAHKDAAYYEAQADAYDRGEINAQGRAINKESQARSEKREAAAEKREKRIATAKERRGDKERWQVPGTVWADAAGYLGGGGRELILGEHRDAVEDAIREGKPVPDDVLAEHNEARGRVSEPGASYEANPKHEFSSTQLDLPDEIASEIKKLAADIPDEDLAKDGREDKPHITVKYGLHTENADKLRELLANEKPIAITFREASFFPNGESDAGDVLKIDIRSPALRALNKKIAAAEPHTDTHPGFKPHATIAYLKPGLGKKYAGKTALTGKSITLHELTFSDKNGETVRIPLGAKPRSRVAELEEKYGTDEAMGVIEGHEGAELPDGGRAAICTDCARFVVQREGGQVVGWEEGANPTATVNDPKLGHDFAIVDGRYIVDPWAKNTAGTSRRAVYDLRSSADKPEIARLYGDRRKWVDLQSDAPYGVVAEKDMFGYDASPEPEQESMFGGKEGTAAARNLEQTERASRNEIEKLKARQAAKPASLLEQTRIAKRIAELEKLVNRNKAISADEMATRAKGEQEEETPPPTRRAKTDDEQSALFERGPGYNVDERLADLKRRLAAGEEPKLKLMPGRSIDYLFALDEYRELTDVDPMEWWNSLSRDEQKQRLLAEDVAPNMFARGHTPPAGYKNFAAKVDEPLARKMFEKWSREMFDAVQGRVREEGPPYHAVPIYAAVKLADGRIFTGSDHAQAFVEAWKAGVPQSAFWDEKRSDFRRDVQQGYVDRRTNRFLTRKQYDAGVREDSPEYRAGRRTAAIPRASPLVVSRKYISDEYKGHPDFAAAKAGDKESAVRFVKAMVDPATVRRARLKFGRNAVYVAPVAIERGGTNAIPQMLAEHYAAEAGGRTDQEIVQATRAYHTGADMMSRIVSPPAFHGAVEKGAKYVLVDDVLMSGGTIAQLADYIQKQGGQVVGVVALANASRSGELHPSKVTLRALERRFGDVIRDEFGIDPKALTRDEAEYLIGFRTADELRNRAAKAREERTERLRRGSVQEKAPPEAGQVRETSGPYEGRSRFYSRLARALDAAPFEKGTPEQWRVQLSKNVPKGEVEWTKIDKYLETEGPSVTKAELRDLFERNRIRLEESVAHGKGRKTPELDAAAKRAEEAENKHARAVDKLGSVALPSFKKLIDEADPEHRTDLSRNPDSYFTSGLRLLESGVHAADDFVARLEGHATRHFSADERKVLKHLAGEVFQSGLELRHARHEVAAHSAGGARWEQHTEPGGENYREIKIHLGPRVKTPYPEPLTELPEEYGPIVDHAQPEGEQWGVVHNDQSNARPLFGRFATKERAIEGAIQMLNEQQRMRHENEWREGNPDFESSHFDEPNILVHARVKDRTLPNGEKVLFVEEIQSDWHEQGRDRGYDKPRAPLGEWKEAGALASSDLSYFPRSWVATHPDGSFRVTEVQPREGQNPFFALDVPQRLSQRLEVDRLARHKTLDAAKEAAARAAVLPDLDAIPDAPFKRSEEWGKLALRRLIEEAVDGGYDRIGFTTGEQQATRFDLSKHVQWIKWRYQPEGPKRYHGDVRTGGPARIAIEALPIESDGDPREMIYESVMPEDLSNAIGKELARKVKEQIADGETEGDFSGDDLKVGGHGIRAFYDEMIPKFAKEVGKELGVKLEIEPVDMRISRTIGDDEFLDLAPSRAELEAALDRLSTRAGYRDRLAAEWARAEANHPGDEQEQFAIQAFLADLRPRNRAAIAEALGHQVSVNQQTIKITPELKKAVEEKGLRLMERAKENYNPAQLSLINPDGSVTKAKDLPAEKDVALPKGGEAAIERIVASVAKVGLPSSYARRTGVEDAGSRVLIDARGRTIRTAQDAAKLMQAFRHPAMEILHAFLLDEEGVVVEHLMHTSGALNMAAFNPQWGEYLARRARAVGAVEVVAGHNHPSGDPTPSNDDLNMTDAVARELDQRGARLRGHIIIDHDKATWLRRGLEGSTSWEQEPVAVKSVPAEWKTGPELRAPQIRNPQQVAALSRAIMDPDALAVLHLDAQHVVIAVEPRPKHAIKDMRWLEQSRRQHASAVSIIVGSEETIRALMPSVIDGQQSSQAWAMPIVDVIGLGEGARYTSYAEQGQVSLSHPDAIDNSIIPLEPGRSATEQLREAKARRWGIDASESAGGEARRGAEGGGSGVAGDEGGRGPNTADLRRGGEFDRVRETDRVAEPSPPYESIKSAAEKVAAAKDDIQQLLAPPSRGGKPTRRAASVIRHRLGEMARENERAVEALKAARNAMFGLPVAERWKWNDDMEHGHMIAQQKMRDIGRVVRKALDDTRDEVRALGKGALEQYIENYMPHIYKQPSKFQDMVRKILGKRPLQGPKSFLKKRSIEYMSDAMAMGFEPVSDNPVDLVLLRLREMRRYIFAQRMWTDMKQRGLVKFVRVGRDLPDGYAKIDDALATVFAPRDAEGAMRIRGYWVAPEPIARLLNNHLRPGLRGHALYDLWNWAGNLMNSVQLGFSAFHLGFTSLDASISKGALAIEQLQSGKPLRALSSAAQAASIVIPPITNVIRGDRVLQEYLHPGSNPAFADMVDAVTKAGGRVRMDSMYRMGHLAKLMDAVRELRQKPATKTLAIALHAPFAVIEASMYPILEVIVPRQKLGVFADLASHALERLRAKGASPDEIQQELAKIWDSVDNRMGQLVYDNLFWSRTVKDLALITTRSVGWNWGTAREVGGGVGDVAYNIADVLRGKKTRLSYRTQYLLALFGITAIAGAILNYLYTGKGPKEIKDYFYPRTGRKDKNGNDDRMSLPGYLKDLVSYWRHPLQTLGHKLHPLLAVASEVMHNRDYYGNMIRNEDAPTDEQLAQSIHFWWEQARPFSVQGAIEAGKRGEPVSRRVGSFVGLTPAPREIVRTPAENKLYELMARRGHTAMTPEQVEASQKRRDMKTDLRDARLSGDTAEARSLIAGVRAAKKSGEVSRRQMQDIVRSSRKRALEMNFKQLSYEDALKVYELADPEERAMWYPLLHRKAQNTGHGRAFMQLNIQRPAANQ